MPNDTRPCVGSVAVHEIRDETELLAARRLHGRRYLEEGFVTELSATGVIDDDWVDHSTYFAAVHPDNGSIIGTLRVIHASSAGFPLLRSMQLHDRWSTELSQVDSKHLAETGSLATVRDPRLMFEASAALSRAAVVHQVRHDIWYILIIVDRRLLRVLNSVVGLPFVQAGPDQWYMGETLPAILDLRRHVIDLRDSTDRRHVRLAREIGPFLAGDVVDLRDPTPSHETHTTS